MPMIFSNGSLWWQIPSSRLLSLLEHLPHLHRYVLNLHNILWQVWGHCSLTAITNIREIILFSPLHFSWHAILKKFPDPVHSTSPGSYSRVAGNRGQQWQEAAPHSCWMRALLALSRRAAPILWETGSPQQQKHAFNPPKPHPLWL